MKLLMIALILTACVPAQLAMANDNIHEIKLFQTMEAQTRHQRLVGNLRAQARREGVVVNVPQLYVYLSDFAAAYHQDSFRTGFERELNLIVQRSRRARSMVRLDRLLEAVRDESGEPVALEALPPADVYLAFYQRADCASCAQIEASVRQWAQDQTELDIVWLDVRLDPRPR